MIVKVARHTVRVSYLIAGVLLIVLALFTITARIGLPLLASHKSSIETRVSAYLKSPVEIGDLSLRWRGTGPMLHATDVMVLEISEHTVQLDELLIDINLAKSLLRGIPIINELSLVGARLAIESDATGQIRLHGMDSIGAVTASEQQPMSSSRSTGVDVMSWLFNARKVGLLNTELTLIDMKADRRIVIDNLNIRAENTGDDHKLRIDARLPEALGGYLQAGVDLAGNASALSESNGDWHVSAESFNISGLTTLLQLGGLIDREASISLGIDAQGSIEMWGRWQDGRLLNARGPLTLTNVVDTRTGDTIIEQASAQLHLTDNSIAAGLMASDIRASLGDVQMELDEVRLERSVVRQAPSTHSLPVESATAAQPALPASHGSEVLWQLTARGDKVPLAVSSRFAAIALSGAKPELAAELRHASVSGMINAFSLDVSGSPHNPTIDLQGEIDALAIRGTTSIPAFGPLDGSVSIENSKGTLELSSQQMPLSWPAASDERLQVDDLAATVDVDLQNVQRMFIGADIQLSDNGIDTSTRVKTTLVPGKLPHLDVQSRFEVSDIAQIQSWLPRKKLYPAATRWIEQALIAGKATNGTLLLFGNLADFPFDNGEGVFRANVDITDGELSFLPAWPVARSINGSVELNGLSLSATADEGVLDQFSASATRAVIGNLALPVLEFSTTAEGNFQDLADFAVTGPLQDLLKPVIGDISGTGDTQMDLALTWPLFRKPEASNDTLAVKTWKPFDITGSVFLDNNDVTFGRADLVLHDVVGAVGFSQRGIAINSISGELLGQPVRLTGNTQGQGAAATTKISVKGALEANDLLAHYGNPLDQFIRGASQWNVEIAAPHSLQRIADEGVTLTLTSDLTGSELLVPAPFNKGTSTAVPFSVSTAFRDDSGNQLWDVQYGDELRTRVRLKDNAFHSMLIELGQFDLTDGPELNIPQGIRLQGSVPSLAADGWIETIAQYINSLPGGDAEQDELEPILPVSVALNIDRLILGRQGFGKASIRANTDETYLNFAVSNTALSGNMRYPRAYWQKSTALKARVKSMDWSVIDALSEAEENPLAGVSTSSALDPRLLPRVEARVSMLTRDNLRLRDLVLRTEPNVSGLDITTLGFAYDTMRLVGQGYWYLRDPQGVNAELVDKHTSQLNLVLQSDDFGVGFDELGLSGVIADTQGTIEMKLGWPGALYSPEIAKLDGTVKLDIEAGSVVPFEPGASRVMGLFALQALPRRLNLDFKDLTHDGLAFKRIAGTANIDNGVADVPLLQLTGPIGVVDIVGTSDLNTQMFDQQVTVLPRVSAALPIIGAISGGASAGVGALVATGVLKAIGVDFDRIGLRTYRLTGPWKEPVLTPVATNITRLR